MPARKTKKMTGTGFMSFIKKVARVVKPFVKASGVVGALAPGPLGMIAKQQGYGRKGGRGKKRVLRGGSVSMARNIQF
jgi:hypothetical protein